MSRFKVGDRVKSETLGKGTVRSIDPSAGLYAVEFDNNIEGHNCSGNCKDNLGRWCDGNELEYMNFTKEDLKAGYVVKCRDSSLRLIMPNAKRGLVLLRLDYKKEIINWTDLERYSLDLLHIADSSWDIIEIYGLSEFACSALEYDLDSRELLWKREDKKEMTIAEIENELGYSIKIIEEEN